MPREGSLSGMNINSFIASMSDIARNPIEPGSETDRRTAHSLNRQVGMYSYLRDKTNAQTVGEAWQGLRQRKVDPKVVRLWVEEGMAINRNEFDAVAEGYPELMEDLKRIQKEKFDEILKRNK